MPFCTTLIGYKLFVCEHTHFCVQLYVHQFKTTLGTLN